MKRVLQIIAVLMFVLTVLVIAIPNNDEITIPNRVIEQIPDNDEIEIVDTVDVRAIAIRSWQEKYIKYMTQLQNCDDSEERRKLFIEFKSFLESESNIVDPPEDLYFCFTDDECELIFRMVETECHGADFDSKMHVANTLFNRWESDDWSNDITTIITSPNQFAYGRTNISESTILAVEAAWLLPDLLDGATFFHSGKYQDQFNGAEYVMSDESHHFYSKEDK